MRRQKEASQGWQAVGGRSKTRCGTKQQNTAKKTTINTEANLIILGDELTSLSVSYAVSLAALARVQRTARTGRMAMDAYSLCSAAHELVEDVASWEREVGL